MKNLNNGGKTVIGLPVTRRQLFKFTFRTHFTFLVKLSLLMSAFALPLFFVIIFNGFFAGNLVITPETTTAEINAVLSRQIFLDLLYIPAILILSLGFAGAYNLMKEYAMQDGYSFTHSFFGGIKKNGLEFFYLGLFFSIVFYLTQFAINYLTIININYYVPAVFVMAIILVVVMDAVVFALCIIPVYRNKFLRTLKNSFLFAFAKLPTITGIVLITYLPLFVVHFFGITLLNAIIIAVYIIIGFGNSVLVTTLYAHHCFDESVNKKSFPEIYRKGLYNGEIETEEAEPPIFSEKTQPSANAEYLKVENISFSYDGKIDVVKDVSFTLGEKDVLCIMGTSGAGKTSLLRVLSGALVEREGDVFIEGVSQKSILPYKRDFSYTFQSPTLYTHLTVYQNLFMAFQSKNKIPHEEMDKTVKEQMQIFGLGDYINLKARYLSEGEKQKVAIAKSLLIKKKLYLFDEPMSALDKHSRRNILNIIKKKKSEYDVPFIYVNHDGENIFGFATKTLILKDGKVVQIDTPENVLKNPKNIVSLKLLSSDYNYVSMDVKDGFALIGDYKFTESSLKDGKYVFAAKKNAFSVVRNRNLKASVCALKSDEKGNSFVVADFGDCKVDIPSEKEFPKGEKVGVRIKGNLFVFYLGSGDFVETFSV